MRMYVMRTGGEAREAEEISRPVEEEVRRVTPSSSDVSLQERSAHHRDVSG